MKRKFLCAIAIFAFPVISSAAVPGGPATGSGSVTTTVPVSLIIPGLIGVDAESEVTFDFNQYGATPAATTTCAAGTNKWPPSVLCANSGLNVHYDSVQGGGTLGTTTTAGIGAASAVANDTAIWLAIFCSETTGSFQLSGMVDAFTGTPGISAATHLKTKQSGSNNTTYTVGYATFTAFGDTTTFHILPAAAGLATATFGWTRVDQAVALEFPGNQQLTEGSYTTTIHYKATK